MSKSSGIVEANPTTLLRTANGNDGNGGHNVNAYIEASPYSAAFDFTNRLTVDALVLSQKNVQIHAAEDDVESNDEAFRPYWDDLVRRFDESGQKLLARPCVHLADDDVDSSSAMTWLP